MSNIESLVIPTLIAYICALLIKFGVYSWQHKKLTFKTILKDGGMPSAHTTAAVGLTTAIYWAYGDTPVFWLGVLFSLIVMKDAMGVRYQTGKQAATINALIRSLQGSSGVKEVKQILGHTPLQVIAGCLMSIIVVSIVHLILV